MLSGIGRKSGPQSVQEGLRGRFSEVFDIDIVLGYKMAEFFDFCRYLTLYGYKADGFDGKLSSPEKLARNQVGNCWDQTELQREWFEKHDYEVRTYLLYYYIRDDFCPSHSILVFRGGARWYWFEPMFARNRKDSVDDWTSVEYAGIHEYESERELLADFRRVFALNGQKTGRLPKILEEKRWALYEYTKPKYGISDAEFYEHCREGRKIDFLSECGIIEQ